MCRHDRRRGGHGDHADVVRVGNARRAPMTDSADSSVKGAGGAPRATGGHVGARSLGYADRQGSGYRKLYALPRQVGEAYADYAARFFREVRGLGHVYLYKGGRRIAARGW